MNKFEKNNPEWILDKETTSSLKERLFKRIKEFFTPDERQAGLTNYQESRRKFLKAVIVGGGMFLLKEIPALAKENDDFGETQDSVTERERSDFSYPEDIYGNESFWGKDVLITIDDCANLEETRKMFETLRSRGLKATFFPNSDYLPLENEGFIDLWREMYRSGFEIGYHTTNHEVTDFTKEELIEDLEVFENHMRVLLGDDSFSIKFARPPYGNWNNTWMKFIKEANLSNIRWNFVPNASVNSIDYFRAVANHPNGGRIILLHPRSWDENWLDEHIDNLQSFTLSEGGRIINLSGNI